MKVLLILSTIRKQELIWHLHYGLKLMNDLIVDAVDLDSRYIYFLSQKSSLLKALGPALNHKQLHQTGDDVNYQMVNSFISCVGSGCAHDKIVSTIERINKGSFVKLAQEKVKMCRASIAKEKAGGKNVRGKELHCYFFALCYKVFPSTRI